MDPIRTKNQPIEAPVFLMTGERAIQSIADQAITQEDTSLAVYPTASYTPNLALPTATQMSGCPAGGKRYRVRDANGGAGAHNITVTASGCLIGGAATAVITTAWGCLDVEWVGNKWHIWGLR